MFVEMNFIQIMRVNDNSCFNCLLPEVYIQLGCFYSSHKYKPGHDLNITVAQREPWPSWSQKFSIIPNLCWNIPKNTVFD